MLYKNYLNNIKSIQDIFRIKTQQQLIEVSDSYPWFVLNENNTWDIINLKSKEYQYYRFLNRIFLKENDNYYLIDYLYRGENIIQWIIDNEQKKQKLYDGVTKTLYLGKFFMHLGWNCGKNEVVITDPKITLLDDNIKNDFSILYIYKNTTIYSDDEKDYLIFKKSLQQYTIYKIYNNNSDKYQLTWKFNTKYINSQENRLNWFYDYSNPYYIYQQDILEGKENNVTVCFLDIHNIYLTGYFGKQQESNIIKEVGCYCYGLPKQEIVLGKATEGDNNIHEFFVDYDIKEKFEGLKDQTKLSNHIIYSFLPKNCKLRIY